MWWRICPHNMSGYSVSYFTNRTWQFSTMWFSVLQIINYEQILCQQKCWLRVYNLTIGTLTLLLHEGISLTTYKSWPDHKHCLVTVITGNGTRIFNTTVKIGPHLVQIPRELNGGHVVIFCYTCSYLFHCAWCLQRCEIVYVIVMSVNCF